MTQVPSATNGSATTPVSEEDVREIVTAAVNAQLAGVGLEKQALPDDLDLLSSGVIDSFGLLELIGAVEDRLGIEIDFEQLDAEQLTVVGPFCRYVAEAARAQRGGLS